MARVGHGPPTFSSDRHRVTVTLLGGAPNTAVTRFDSSLPTEWRANPDPLMVMLALLGQRTVTAARLATVLQKVEDEVEVILQHLSGHNGSSNGREPRSPIGQVCTGCVGKPSQRSERPSRIGGASLTTSTARSSTSCVRRGRSTVGWCGLSWTSTPRPRLAYSPIWSRVTSSSRHREPSEGGPSPTGLAKPSRRRSTGDGTPITGEARCLSALDELIDVAPARASADALKRRQQSGQVATITVIARR
jgi:hypothetical protein